MTSSRTKIQFEKPQNLVPSLDLPEKINIKQLHEISQEIGDLFDANIEETSFVLAGVVQSLVEKIKEEASQMYKQRLHDLKELLMNRIKNIS